MKDTIENTDMNKIIGNVLETWFEDIDKDTMQNARERIKDTVGCLIGGPPATPATRKS